MSYPECEKLAAEHGRLVVVQEFLDWLDEHDLVLCERAGANGRYETLYVPQARRPEVLIHEFLGIDARRLESERRAMLDALRAPSRGPETAPGETHTKEGT